MKKCERAMIDPSVKIELFFFRVRGLVVKQAIFGRFSDHFRYLSTKFVLH